MDSKPMFPNSEHLKCSLCSEYYKDPKTLPCLHTFCKICIIRSLEQHCANKPSKCPECLETFVKDPEDVNPNTYMQNMIHLLKTQSDCTDQVCSFCRLLEDIRPAVSQCLTCLDFLCEECATSRHTFTTITKDHTVVPLTEIRTGQHNKEIRSLQCSENCHVHINEELRYFCIPCKTVTCRDCTIMEHRSHEVRLISDVRKEKENLIQHLRNELTLKLSALEENKDSIKSKQSELCSLKTQMENDISRRCSGAVSKIEKGKNKMLMELEKIMTPKMQSLISESEKISRFCKNIEDSLQFSEIMQMGKDCEVVLLLEDIYERFENLAKAYSSENCLMEDIPNLTIQIAEPQLELLVNKTKSPLTSAKCGNGEKCIPKDSDENTSLSDFVTYSSKAVQTSEEDFKITKENKEITQRKYKVKLLRRFDLSEKDDKFKPIYSGVAWVDENQFVAVDKPNAKIKMVSLPSAKILKSVSGYQPLAVSVWRDGISCLSIDNQMTFLSRDFVVQKTFSGVSALFSSLPSVNQLMWTAKSVIYYQKKNVVTEIPVKDIPSNACFLRHACSLPNGLNVVSDTVNLRVYLFSMGGELMETLYCYPGSISFDKYYNIFISDYENSSIIVFDIEGHYKENLLVEDRPRSISILNDKLLIATENNVLLYDIFYVN